MNLYNLRMLAPNKFQMAKFSADFNVEAVYNLEPKGYSYTCDCPANQRSVVTKPCKHKRMMPLMLGAVNTDRFYDPEARTWCQPLAQPHEEAALELAEPIAGEAVDSPKVATSCDCFSMDECDERAGCQVLAAKGEAVGSKGEAEAELAVDRMTEEELIAGLQAKGYIEQPASPLGGFEEQAQAGMVGQPQPSLPTSAPTKMRR